PASRRPERLAAATGRPRSDAQAPWRTPRFLRRLPRTRLRLPADPAWLSRWQPPPLRWFAPGRRRRPAPGRRTAPLRRPRRTRPVELIRHRAPTNEGPARNRGPFGFANHQRLRTNDRPDTAF